jgi:hypothetical protein
MARQSASGQQQPRSSRGGRVALAGGLAAAGAAHNRPRPLSHLRVPRLGIGARPSSRRRGSVARASSGATVRAPHPLRATASVQPRQPRVAVSVQRRRQVSAPRRQVSAPPVTAPSVAAAPAPKRRGLSDRQLSAHARRLSAQSRDLGARGKGSRAQRRLASGRSQTAPAVPRSDGHVRGLSRGNRVKSRAQQRLLFARHEAYAHAAAKRGAAYQALPDHVRAKS